MYINETLAKGLKERLWNELEALAAKPKKIGVTYLKSHKIKLGSRNVVRKFEQALKLDPDCHILGMTKSGTRANQILLYQVLDADSQADRNDWREKMFNIRTISIDSWANWEFYPAKVRIGEHAVSRVFQRHPEIYSSATEDFEIFKIIPEFQSIALTGQLMLILFTHVAKHFNHSFDGISIPFVSNSGLFLGDYNRDLGSCDVRTFIANHQLTQDQMILANHVRKCFEFFEDNSVHELAFVAVTKDGFAYATIFFSRLYKVAPHFVEQVTLNVVNSAWKREVQQLITDFLRGFHEVCEQAETHAA